MRSALPPIRAARSCPLDTVSRYVGKELALSLTRSGEAAGETRWPGHLVVTDPFDQVIYEADGLVQCGA